MKKRAEQEERWDRLLQQQGAAEQQDCSHRKVSVDWLDVICMKLLCPYILAMIDRSHPVLNLCFSSL